jgi:hypothetical protein
VTTLMQTQDIEPDLGDTRDSIVLPPKSPNSQTSLGTGPINGGADVPILAEDVPWYGEQLNRDLKTQPLSKMALRNAYRREATCHEGLLKRTRAAGRAVPPRIHAFRDFLAIVGPAPAWKATIDRRLNDWRDYEPENVRWADKPTQTNNRETTILIQPPNGGQPLTTIQLARRQKVTDGAIRRRRSRGWTDAENTLGKRAPTLTIAPTPEIESDSLRHVWTRAMLDAYPGEDFVLSGAERGVLRNFAKDCPDASEVLAYTIKNWSDFTHKVRFDHGRHPNSLPDRPDPAFLLKHLRCARNLYLKGNNLIIGGDLRVRPAPSDERVLAAHRANNKAHNDWITRSDRSEPQPPLLSDAQVRAALYSEDEAPFLPDNELDNL